MSTMAKRVVVAIDGPAGAGKSTIARRLAGRLGFTYIDTGAMYRTVALVALRSQAGLSDLAALERIAREVRIDFAPGTSRIRLDGVEIEEAIRTPEIASAASKISVYPPVRRALVEKQREIAATSSVVMEGRDIGSVVFPEADVKIYLDADPNARAHRRIQEMAGKGEMPEEDLVAREMRERDERDRSRSEAPLVQAPDAVYLDSTPLGVDEVEQVILKIIRERISNGKEFAH
jgi:CMP/dCMP kinase